MFVAVVVVVVVVVVVFVTVDLAYDHAWLLTPGPPSAARGVSVLAQSAKKGGTGRDGATPSTATSGIALPQVQCRDVHAITSFAIEFPAGLSRGRRL